jgi:uncharacterized membrane protein
MVTDELRNPVIVAHAAGALFALGLGSVILLRRKGTVSHRTLGWVWVITMAAVAIAAIPIRTSRGIPNLYGFTPIHLFVLLVAFNLPRAVWAIYNGNVKSHGAVMRRLFFGALVIAGVFTLLPGRLLGHLLWHNLLGVI